MAAIALGSLSIDPAKTAKYPITISEQLLGEVGRETKQHALLHCLYQTMNLDPNPSNPHRQSTTSPDYLTVHMKPQSRNHVLTQTIPMICLSKSTMTAMVTPTLALSEAPKLVP